MAEKMIMYETMNMAPMCAVAREGGKDGEPGCMGVRTIDIFTSAKESEMAKQMKKGGKHGCDLLPCIAVGPSVSFP